MTDDTPPLQSSSELRNAIFKADGEHDSPNPEAPEAQISDMLESASPKPGGRRHWREKALILRDG